MYCNHYNTNASLIQSLSEAPDLYNYNNIWQLEGITIVSSRSSIVIIKFWGGQPSSPGRYPQSSNF